MLFELTQNSLNIAIVTVLIIGLITVLVLKAKYTIRYDKSIKLRQHKLYSIDCTLEQAVSDITIVNGIEEFYINAKNVCN